MNTRRKLLVVCAVIAACMGPSRAARGAEPAGAGESLCAGNDPPVCAAASAAPGSLWPPDRRMAPITITVPDPDGDPVAVTVLGITSDEPVDASGSGSTAPDCAGHGTAMPEVRAERGGGGDGRLYTLAFRADDGRGGTCEGEVTVCVPASQAGGSCAAGGQAFDCRGACAPGPDTNCCPDGATSCAADELCHLRPATGVYECLASSECQSERVCGAQCCPLGSRCVGGACPLPDLSVDASALHLCMGTLAVAEGDCVLDPQEGPCVGGSGQRTLLRFATRTPNLGAGDFFLGAPADNPDVFRFATCHGHDHFDSYARHQILDAAGCEVTPGAKRGFCLCDTDCPAGTAPRYDCQTCDDQGISAGCSDSYHEHLPCQWVDVTGLPPGGYTLRVSVNFERLLAESSYANNTIEVPLTLPYPTPCLP